jgi:phospholipid/cholesterol/gamma-HCH transport system substrate-binding protein
MKALTGRLEERTRMILTGAITLALISALVVVGVKIAFGALDGGYELQGRFTAAGQGLIPGSDVKVRGVDIGEVKRIELVNGKALVTVRIQDGQRVPRSTRAVVRPKTLFGEKFVDLELGDGESSGPYLRDGDFFEKTLGGFELEQVLAEAYPVLEAVDPIELATVLGTLADSGHDLGPVINRQIVNGEKVFDVGAAHAEDTRQFLRDLALLSDELADRADDVVGAAVDLNEALPPLNERGDELATLLDDASRLSGDLADVLEANRSFLRKGVTEGGKGLQVLFDERARIGPLVTGLRQYIQTLTEVIRLPLEDGTLAAAVKGITGGDAALLIQGHPPGESDEGTDGLPPVTIPNLPPVTLPGVTVPTVPGQVPAPGAQAEQDQNIGDVIRGLFR